LIEEWEKLTKREAPGALAAFAEDPDAALDDLLDEVGEPDVVARTPAGAIGNWLAPMSAGSALAKAIDGSVEARLEREWLPSGKEDPGGRRRALLLTSLFDVIASAPGKLPGSAQALVDRFAEHDEALAPWSPAPSQDPLGRFLLAVARNQSDRHLAPYWFNLCRLPANVPLFRAEYGVAGLRGLPRREDPPEDEFPHEVAAGLRLLADGVRVAAEAGRIDPDEGRATVLELAQISISAYPLAGWEEALLANVEEEAPLTAEYLREMAQLDQRALSGKMLHQLFEQASLAVRSAPAVARRPKRRRVPFNQLKRDLEAGKDGADEQVQYLIDDEIVRMEREGDFGGKLGKLLRQGSNAARKRFPEASVRWSQEALWWEPWDVRSWTSASVALRGAGELERALDTAWKAQARFPFNHHTWVEVGLALEEQGRIKMAAATFKEAIFRFPEEAPPISAYAEMLLEAGQPEEAVDLLRPAVELFGGFDETPENAANLWGGLTAALISVGKDEEARQAAIDGLGLFPDNAWAQRRVKNFEKFRQRRHQRDAEIRKRLPLEEEDPQDPTLFSVLSEARLLRQSARRRSRGSAEAGRLLESRRREGEHDPLFLAELIALEVDHGEPQKALEELDRTPLAEGVDPNVAYAATRAKRVKMAAAGDGSSAERRYTPAALASLTSRIRTAADATPVLRPVALVSALQGTAAMFDGEVLDGERTRLYGELRSRLRRMTEPGERKDGGTAEEASFEDEWASAVKSLWSDVGERPSGGEIAAAVEASTVRLDDLGEDFVRRIAVLA